MIRAYLSSYRLGRRAGVLRWAGTGRGRAVIVMNALDGYDERLRSWGREMADLDSLGYTPTELDLREPGELSARLAESDLIWVVGGNAFVLARTMTAVGFGPALRAAQTDGGPVYAGYSAGACVAGPDLAGIELVDDAEHHPAGTPDAPPKTLGLIRQRVVPHWRSDHPESAAAERVIAELDRRGLVHLPLRDGDDVLVGEDDDRSDGAA